MKRAFTIIELLVVIGIIGILIGVLIGTFSGSTESARAAKCQANMHNLAMAVQAYGMAQGHYPRASTVEHRISGSRNTETVHGWLGDKTNPYESGADARRTCFDHGAIWPVTKWNAKGEAAGWKVDSDSCVCPSHQRYAKDHSMTDPLWSYAMSAYFDMGKSSGGVRSGVIRRQYAIRRADRYLLFAELPYAQMKVGGTEIQQGVTSGAALDPVLDYDGGEVIGFNHREGKVLTGHVCFADGHVEKLRAPNDKSNIKDLTKWLCRPTDDQSGDFDISFSDGTYKQDFTKAKSDAE